MTDQEIYDEFFADEECDLETASAYEYSYWNGWNSGLKRAAILISDEVRPHGEWINNCYMEGNFYHTCNQCNMEIVETAFDNFCPNCGADMRKGGAE